MEAMSAYSKSVIHLCQMCGKRANYEVFNSLNASLGYYCYIHARVKVRDLDRASEARDRAARMQP